MLNLQSIEKATLRKDPYQWSLIENTFNPETASLLASEFPNYKFNKIGRDWGTDKRYRFASKILVDKQNNRIDYDKLSKSWQHTINLLCSDSYRQALGKLTNLNLSQDLLEIGCFRYHKGCYVSPNPDKPQKSVGHLMYFNTTWQSQWGGEFKILRNQSEDSFKYKFSPLAGTSILTVRSDCSWHSVSVLNGPVERLVLYADFWRSDPGESPGRFTLS